MIELTDAIKQLDNITLKLYICRVFEARLGLSCASAAAERARSQPVGKVRRAKRDLAEFNKGR